MAETSHQTKLVVNGDASGAVGALGAIKNALGGVSRAASVVTRALGIFGLAVQGVQALVQGYKWLKDRINQAATAANELRRTLEASRHASQIALQSAAYKKLNEELAKTLALEKERNALADASTRRERDVEDAQAEQRKQGEIAALDVNDKDYDAKKSAIERKYESEASDTAKWRASEDARLNSARLYDEADASDALVKELEKLVEKAKATENADDLELTRVRNEGFAKARKEGWSEEGALRYGTMTKEYKAAEKTYEESRAKRESYEKAVAEATSRSAVLRAQAQNAERGGEAAEIRDAATQLRIQNDANRNAAKKRQEEADKAAKEAEESAKKQADKEKRWEDWQRDQARGEAQDAEVAKLERRKASLEDLISRQQGGSLSSNRLTAMGLGAGVSNPFRSMDTDVKHIVKLLEKQIEETKKQHAKDNARVAIFGE